MTHKFDPKNREILDSHERRELFDPQQVLKLMQIKSKMIIADIGCGTGFLTVPLVGIVGQHGKVYGIDISEEMLEEVQKKIAEKNFKNVKTLLSQENDIPLNNDMIDYCLLSFVFHELENVPLFCQELRRILKKDGLIGIIEWKKIESPMGPPVEERISADEIERMLSKNGFVVKKKMETGDYNYGLVMSMNHG